MKYFLSLLIGLLWIHNFSFAAAAEELVGDSISKRISLHYAHSGPVSSWIDKMDIIFPPESKSFDVRLNLKDFDRYTLNILNSFLIAVSEKPGIVSKITNITMSDGTSFRFNKIKSGIKAIAMHDEGVKLEYIHSGIQTPTSPAHTLTEVAKARGYKLLDISKGHFIVNPAPEVVDDASTISDLIERIPQDTERFEKEETYACIQAKYEAIPDHDLPAPVSLGIGNKNQIREIYGDDLEKYETPAGVNPIYIRVSGMRGDNVDSLYNFCNKYTMVKAVKFIDSAMKIEDIEPILPLIGSQLIMLDLTGAFGEYDDRRVSTLVSDFLGSKEQFPLIKYCFFGDFPIDPSLRDLDHFVSNQKAMKLINDYIDLMEEDN